MDGAGLMVIVTDAVFVLSGAPKVALMVALCTPVPLVGAT